MSSRVSVVLATYNGMSFLKEQLDSIKNQSKIPDEVIIKDDCSSDGTTDYIQRYIEENALLGWTLIKNTKNEGWKKNFKDGFDLATGDFIFPADQDDIWHLDKIEKMTRIMEQLHDCELLVSNYQIFFDGEKKGGGYKRYQKEMKNNGSIQKLDFTEKWAYVQRPGCVFCFTKSFFEAIKSLWTIEYAHDSILWRFALIRNGAYLYNSEMIDFRRHGNNVTSNQTFTKSSKIESIDALIPIYDSYLQYAKENNCIAAEYILCEGLKFLQIRKKCLSLNSMRLWLKLLFNYRKHYLRVTSVLSDLRYLLKGSSKNEN